jgi:hypothetical protein
MFRRVAALLAIVTLAVGAIPHCASGATNCGWFAQAVHECCRPRMGIQTPRCCAPTVQHSTPIPTGLNQDGGTSGVSQLAAGGTVVETAPSVTGRTTRTDLPDRGLSPPQTLLHLHCSLLV